MESLPTRRESEGDGEGDGEGEGEHPVGRLLLWIFVRGKEKGVGFARIGLRAKPSRLLNNIANAGYETLTTRYTPRTKLPTPCHYLHATNL